MGNCGDQMGRGIGREGVGERVYNGGCRSVGLSVNLAVCQSVSQRD